MWIPTVRKPLPVHIVCNVCHLFWSEHISPQERSIISPRHTPRQRTNERNVCATAQRAICVHRTAPRDAQREKIRAAHETNTETTTQRNERQRNAIQRPGVEAEARRESIQGESSAVVETAMRSFIHRTASLLDATFMIQTARGTVRGRFREFWYGKGVDTRRGCGSVCVQWA